MKQFSNESVYLELAPANWQKCRGARNGAIIFAFPDFPWPCLSVAVSGRFIRRDCVPVLDRDKPTAALSPNVSASSPPFDGDLRGAESNQASLSREHEHLGMKARRRPCSTGHVCLPAPFVPPHVGRTVR